MKEEEWYFHFQAIANKMFEDFKSHIELLSADGKKNYLSSAYIDNNNIFFFNIGHNRLMVKYGVNLKTLELCFKTFLIEPSQNHYGSFSINELDDFEFKVDSYKSMTFTSPKEHTDPVYKRTYTDKRINDFPASFLNVLKKSFLEFL